MKNLKKLTAVGMVLALTAGLAACGGGSSSTKDIMKSAQEEMAKVKSMSYDMAMEMNMSVAGQKIETSTTGNIDFISDPLAMKMDMVTDMGAQGSADIKMYAEASDGNYIMYMTNDGTNWMKQTMEDLADLEQYNAQESMDLYLKGIKDFKEVGTEEIKGSNAVRFDGVISKDALGDVMAASGAASQLAQFGMSQEEIDAMYTDLADLPISVWIDKESSLPVKYEMDMTQIMQQMMNKMLEAMDQQSADIEFKVDKMFISMTLSNFNNVDKIEIPEEARNAQETTF